MEEDRGGLVNNHRGKIKIGHFKNQDLELGSRKEPHVFGPLVGAGADWEKKSGAGATPQKIKSQSRKIKRLVPRLLEDKKSQENWTFFNFL